MIFLLRELTSNEKNFKVIFDEIIGLDVKDGFQFDPVEVSQLSLENKKYPGFRLTIIGHLGQVKNKSTIDIGVGDVVRAGPLSGNQLVPIIEIRHLSARIYFLRKK